MADQGYYNNWTKAGLIQRVKELEKQLKATSSSGQISTLNEEPQARREVSQTAPQEQQQQQQQVDGLTQTIKKPKGKKKMDPSKYSTRYIALKLAYLGKNYGGFEFQAMGNQPSIEEELWNALTKACLIFPEDDKVVDFDCCEYSKCGRTDRGVSAFGQVIGLRVRSNRPLPKEQPQGDGDSGLIKGEPEATGADQGQRQDKSEEQAAPPAKPFDDIRDEIPYPHVLNRLLPKEIRILAWCPSPPPDFSARFSCRERQYRYFFTQPAFAPTPSHIEGAAAKAGGKKPMKPGWLNIEAMRDAAKRYEGEHDFRNLCKVDPAKQITNFKRRMFESDIVEVKDAASALPYLKAAGFAPEDMDSSASSGGVYPKVYYFHVRGSAFLWHQIRHMVAILFLVGQGLEHPSLVSELLDVEKNPRRPNYVMADEVPLVLWDCIFPSDLSASTAAERKDDALRWVYVGEDGPSGRFGQFGIMDDAWQMWRERRMDEILASQLLQHVSQQGSNGTTTAAAVKATSSAANSTKVFEGGNGGRLSGKYPGVMKMKLLESADEQNDKYAKRKGYADAEDMRAKKGFRSNKAEEGDTTMADE
ncbi:trna pseudouridine38 39 synthase [Trichoderma arundinaceum]|uniref:Trna pseudouridine38 39 synthase n=1 Tax=Trichoderma arundinaceum TaxID=490622 RepID=A0A395NKA5_TRIAR|nr:trna pseudouridine38 39 synthase [Trichoderma arundinaceum]